jgi:hypothetical protein
MQMVERKAAHLRAERVEVAAHHARQVVERVLYNSRRRESQRLSLGYHQPIRPEESWEQGSRQGVKAWGLQEWAWYPPREVEMDYGGSPEGVEARHSEAWASEPAELERHLLGETEDASEELLCTVQEPGEEAGRP